MSTHRLTRCLAGTIVVGAALTISLGACSKDNGPKATPEEIFLTRVNLACAKATEDLPQKLGTGIVADPNRPNLQVAKAAVDAFRAERATLTALVPPASLETEYRSEVLAGLPAIQTQFEAVLYGSRGADPKELLADAKAAYAKLRTFYTAHKVNACLAGIPKNA